MPSLHLAKQHFLYHVLPRRVRDPNAENLYFKKYGRMKRIYRRVGPTEVDRGEPYPCCSAGVSQLAHFGLGVGVYYLQLVIQSAVFVIAGLVLIPAFLLFGSSDYGVSSQDPRLYASGACSPGVLVNATQGCDNGEFVCSVLYRSNCELSRNAIVADFAMSVVVIFLVFLAKIPEKELLDQLDEAVQTLQDYSVVVNNPPRDASDSDEWQDFFSRFGTVRLVTIAKDNARLVDNLVQKQILLQKLDDISRNPTCCGTSVATIESRIRVIDKELEEAFKRNYDVLRVYVTFDLEEHQRLCLNELEVPNIDHIRGFADVKQRTKFRGQHVLDVVESPEFDNIHWQNLGITYWQHMQLLALSWILAIALLVCCYFLINWARKNYLTQLPIFITLADITLSVLFERITLIECAIDEDDHQDSLLLKLLSARVLISILFPYIFTSWEQFLNASNVIAIINTQLAACFISPILSFFDLYGIFKRYVLSYISSETQHDLNLQWRGSDWSLAERYTNFAKISVLTLFYALLSPLGVFIGAAALFIVFIIDRYLLVRKLTSTYRIICLIYITS